MAHSRENGSELPSGYLEELGPHALKGVAEPMQVFRALGPTESHRDEDESMPDGRVFLVGRDEEVGLLLRRWVQAKEGVGQVVLINGEAGIGKSSLVATVRAHVLEEGYTRITFRCSPYHTNSALYPMITHLEQMLGFERNDTPGTKLDKLEQALKATNLPLEEAVPLLATRLSVPLEDRYPALTLSPQQQRQQTLDTLVAWLMEESEKQPVLAVWEDLHWSDPSTLEMLSLMVDQSPTAAILNLLTFRPEFSPPWPPRSHMTPLTLNRLERPQVEALLTHLADGKALPTEVVTHIVTKTDGVPLYVEELTKMLLASDVLQEETDQYVLTGLLSTVAIPDTLQDSLMARLDQLNQAKEVAQLGAVIGREFPYEFIQAISSQNEETLQTGLAQLVEAELLYQRGRPPRAKYVFKHALIQDAAYASLLRSIRQQLHKRIAQLLEREFPETVATQPSLVAHHYTEASLCDQASAYWLRSGERANQQSAYAEAVADFRKGLEVLTHLPKTAERLQSELTLQLALGTVLRSTLGYAAPEVDRTYARVRELFEQVGETPQHFQMLWGLCSFYLNRLEFQAAREFAEQSLQLAQRQDDVGSVVVAQSFLGFICQLRGEYVESRPLLEQAIALYNPKSHHALAFSYGQDPGVMSLGYLAFTLLTLGYPDQALQKGHEACALAQELSHPFSLAHALSNMALVHRHRRDVEALQRCAETLLELASEHELIYMTVSALVMQGWVLIFQGEIEAGLNRACQGITRAPEPRWQSEHGLLANVYARIGRADEGQRALAEAIALIEENHGWRNKAELHRLQGDVLLQQAETDGSQAEACFHQALDVARTQQAKSLELRAATSLARLWQSQGKRQEAHDLLAPVYNWFTEGFDTADLQAAKALLDKLEVR